MMHTKRALGALLADTVGQDIAIRSVILELVKTLPPKDRRALAANINLAAENSPDVKAVPQEFAEPARLYLNDFAQKILEM